MLKVSAISADFNTHSLNVRLKNLWRTLWDKSSVAGWVWTQALLFLDDTERAAAEALLFCSPELEQNFRIDKKALSDRSNIKWAISTVYKFCSAKQWKKTPFFCSLTCSYGKLYNFTNNLMRMFFHWCTVDC